MKNTIKSPELAKQEYDRGMITPWGLFQYLLALSQTYSVSRIVAVLDENQSREFEDFVRSLASVRSNDELVSINGAPFWGVDEVRKCIDYFDEQTIP